MDSQWLIWASEQGPIQATFPVGQIWKETASPVAIQAVGTFLSIVKEYENFLGEREGQRNMVKQHIVFLIYPS